MDSHGNCTEPCSFYNSEKNTTSGPLVIGLANEVHFACMHDSLISPTGVTVRVLSRDLWDSIEWLRVYADSVLTVAVGYRNEKRNQHVEKSDVRGAFSKPSHLSGPFGDASQRLVPLHP